MIWVSFLHDAYGLAEIELSSTHERAVMIGREMLMKVEHLAENEVDVIENYGGQTMRTEIIRKRSPDEFFPGETSVSIFQREIK